MVTYQYSIIKRSDGKFDIEITTLVDDVAQENPMRLCYSLEKIQNQPTLIQAAEDECPREDADFSVQKQLWENIKVLAESM